MRIVRRKIGDFYVVEQIGSGGMSNVFLGLNPRTREKRAIKVVARRATSSPGIYARFQREVEIIRRLAHPNIIKILDSGVLADCYYYQMEYMPDGSLARRLKRGRVPVPEALSLFAAISGGVAYAHEKGVVHRDLKPGNVLIDSRGQPIVSDFGIAKILEESRTMLTKSHEIMGTLAYLAPEQRCGSKRVDRRADVYALGALIYEMVMGFPPLGNFPRPSETLPDFPEPLQRIIDQCLRTDPEQRYAHAGVLLASIARILGGDVGRIGESLESPLKKIGAGDRWDPITVRTDRIEAWLHVLRGGTTRERLAAIHDMIETMDGREAKAILKLYPSENDRVRWGLTKVMGEMKIRAATVLLVRELKNSYVRESAIEALGKIGAEEAFSAIRQFVEDHPESAKIALLPLAQSGGQRALKHLRPYMTHDMSVFRQACAQAIAAIVVPESVQILKGCLAVERDEHVRGAVIQGIHSIETALCGDAGCATETEVLTQGPSRPGQPSSSERLL
jgi:hypothetical protein